MQSKLPIFDHMVDDSDIGAPDEDSKALMAAFSLAGIEPENFLGQVSWDVSDDINDMVINPPAESAAACFHSRIWLDSWAKSITADHRVSLKIVIGKFAGTPVIAIPMCVVTSRLLTRVQFAAQDVCDYNTPLLHQGLASLSSRRVMNRLFGELSDLFPQADCLDLRKCLLENDIPLEGRGPWLEEPEGSHLCPLSGNWENDLSQFVGKSSRKSLKRKLKKLQSMGEVTFSEPVTLEQKQQAIGTLIEWKTDQLSELGAASIFENRDFRDLLKTAVMQDRSGMVRPFGMYIDGEPVALTLMLCRQSRWFLYQTAYTSDEAGKYSPGYLLLLHIMEQAADGSIPVFDFGWGNEGYKARFAAVSQPLYRAYVPLTLKGRIARLVSNAGIAAKELVKSNKYTRSAAKYMLRVAANLRHR